MLLTLGASFAIFALVFSLSTPPAAHAANGADFDAGNIISDSLFYNGAAMNASQIQTFLNQRVPRCTIGDPGRTAGMAWGNTQIAQDCLRNYSMNTVSIAADRYCASYAGGGRETAAQIISKVALACGISPRILLVTLEKEQSLVTDSWPTVRQLDVAMGANCPDSGPNWSASCDPRFYGLQKQVHRAAWLFKYYELNPTQYRFQAGRTVAIQFHPNPACGTRNVFITNKATAALYIYTPYVPNQAALNNVYGLGNSCSAYGNRNFWRMYTDWFGSTRGFTTWGDIDTYWQSKDAGIGIFGYPVSNSSFRATRFPQGIWVQTFSGGVITTEMNTGVTRGIPFGRLYDYWNSQKNGIFGTLGAPVSDPVAYATNGGGVLQWFQGGLVVSAQLQDTIASVGYGVVFDLYNDVAGGIYGELGYPLGDFSRYIGGSLQNFQGGVIAQADGFVTPVFVSGEIYDHYNSVAGGIYGRLGFPVGNAETMPDGTQHQAFRNGFIIRSSIGEISEINGRFFAAYRQAKLNGIDLGPPESMKTPLTVDGGG
jgi:hypothetical protein